MEWTLLIGNLLLWLLWCATFVYIGFIVCLWIGIRRLSPPLPTSWEPFVSVVIPARNEEKNISKILQDLLSQTYNRENYEIIVIDDFSQDRTVEMVQTFADFGVRLLHLERLGGLSPKKAALHQAIVASRGELILTTDADCRVPATWISTLVNAFDKDTAVAASWVKVETNHTLLSKIETLDSMAFVLIGAASFGLKLPFLANGANFAYRREVYFQVNGFDGNYHLGSGDDDLFLQKIYATKKWQAVFADSPHSVVKTHANTSLRGFLEQRYRWASKTSAYPRNIQALEVFLYFYFLLLLGSIYLTFTLSFLFALPLLTKGLVDYAFVKSNAKQLKSVPLFYFILGEGLQLFYTIVVGIWGMFGTYTWKGRKYSRGKAR